MSAFDERHGCAIDQYQAITEIPPPHAARVRHRVTLGPFNLETLLLPRESETLVVALHGALGPEIERPRFQYLRTMEKLGESTLFLADPTVEAHPKLRLGWYLGSSELPASDQYAAYIEHIAELIGAKRIILFGHSGGGFAAAAIAHRLKNALAITFNAQTIISKYAPWATEQLRKAIFPQMPFDEVESRYAHLVNLLELYRQPSSSRLIAYQIVGDTNHYENHWKPFARSLGVAEGGGKSRDGRYDFRVGTWGIGHAGPQGPEIRRIVINAITQD